MASDSMDAGRQSASIHWIQFRGEKRGLHGERMEWGIGEEGKKNAVCRKAERKRAHEEEKRTHLRSRTSKTDMHL